MHIDTIQYPIAVRQISRRKWKARRDRARVHIAADLQLVGQLRNRTIEPLLLLARRYLAKDQLLSKNRLNLVLNEI